MWINASLEIFVSFFVGIQAYGIIRHDVFHYKFCMIKSFGQPGCVFECVCKCVFKEVYICLCVCVCVCVCVGGGCTSACVLMCINERVHWLILLLKSCLRHLIMHVISGARRNFSRGSFFFRSTDLIFRALRKYYKDPVLAKFICAARKVFKKAFLGTF